MRINNTTGIIITTIISHTYLLPLDSDIQSESEVWVVGSVNC